MDIDDGMGDIDVSLGGEGAATSGNMGGDGSARKVNGPGGHGVEQVQQQHLPKVQGSMEQLAGVDKNKGNGSISDYPNIITSKDLPLIYEFLAMVLPLPDEEISEFLGTTEINFALILYLFNGFIETKLIFPLDCSETIPMVQAALENQPGETQASRDLKKMSLGLSQNLRKQYPGQQINDIRYFTAAFDLDKTMIKKDVPIILGIMDMKNQKILFVSLGSELSESERASHEIVQKLGRTFAKCVNESILGNSISKVDPLKITVTTVTQDFHFFILESCEDPYLRYLILLYLMMYDNATDKYDLEGFKESLQIEDFSINNALRLVSTIKFLQESSELREKFNSAPEIGESLMTNAENLMRQECIQVIPKLSEQFFDAEEISQLIRADLAELYEASEGSEKVFSVLEYCVSETERFVYYLCLQDSEPPILMYLTANKEPENQDFIDILKKNISGLEVFSHTARHQFCSAHIDIFLFAWFIQSCELEPPSALESLKLLAYNEAAVVRILSNDMNPDEGVEGGDIDDEVHVAAKDAATLDKLHKIRHAIEAPHGNSPGEEELFEAAEEEQDANDADFGDLDDLDF